VTIHTVIESIAAYEAVRVVDPSRQRVWWTTSPKLLATLPDLGEDVRSPEQGFPQEQFDALGRSARDLGVEFADWYQGKSTWSDYAIFRFVIATTLARCFFVTAYKAILLSRIVNAAGDNPVVCVGNPDEPELSGFSMGYGRVDTLFSFVAAEASELGVVVKKHEHMSDASQIIDNIVRNRPMGKLEKLLSILNNTPGSFFYKIWRNLQQKGLYPFSGITLWPFGRRTLWLFKGCELLEETVLGLLIKGKRIRHLPPIPRLESDLIPPRIPDSSIVVDRITELVHESFTRYGQAGQLPIDAVIRVVTRRTLRFLGIIRWKLPELTARFEQMVRNFNKGDEILTNELTAPIEGLFYSFCRSRGIPVNAFEHGVTLGLSEWSVLEGKTRGMLAADRGFYHCPRAINVVGDQAPWQKMHVVGLPKVMTNTIFRPVFKRIGRRLIGVKKKARVVMYVSDLDHNNFIWGPQLDNDLQYFVKTKQVIEALCMGFPRSTIVLKLYPTQRYIDAYDFSDLAKRYSNLRIIGGIDFRFLRASADLIVTSSTQSTLGWVSTAGVPFVVLGFKWCPTRVEGLHFSLAGIGGLSAAIIPDEGAVCLGEPTDVAEILCGS